MYSVLTMTFSRSFDSIFSFNSVDKTSSLKSTNFEHGNSLITSGIAFTSVSIFSDGEKSPM